MVTGPNIHSPPHRPINLVNAKLPDAIFYLSKDFLLEYPHCLKNLISKQPITKKVQVRNVVPGDFQSYLDWIQDEELNVKPKCDLDPGRDCVQQQLSCKHGKNDATVAKIATAIRMLRMGVVIEDALFSNSVFVALKLLTLGTSSVPVALSLSQGEEMWIAGRNMILWKDPDREAFTRWLTDHIVKTYTREQVEQCSATLDTGFLEAIRKLLPFPKLTIRSGGMDAQRIAVTRIDALERSLVLFKALNEAGNSSEDMAKAETASDGSCDILLAGDFAPRVIEDWAATLVEDGNELNSLCASHPNISISKDDATLMKTRLSELYIFAKAIEDKKIQKSIFTALVSYSDQRICKKESLAWKTVAMVANKTVEGCSLRRWVVDVLSCDVVRHGVSTSIDLIPPTLHKELFVQVQGIYGLKPSHITAETTKLENYLPIQ